MHRDGDDGDQRERDHRDELGDEQPGPADGAGQQVAQRARGRLAGDGVARHHRDGDRQEHRQHEGQRRRRVKLPVVEHRRQERAALPRRRRQVGDRDEDGHDQRQRADERDREPGPHPAAQLEQFHRDHDMSESAAGARVEVLVGGRRCLAGGGAGAGGSSGAGGSAGSGSDAGPWAPGTPNWSEPAPVTSSTISSRVRRCASSDGDRHARRYQAGVQGRRVGGRAPPGRPRPCARRGRPEPPRPVPDHRWRPGRGRSAPAGTRAAPAAPGRRSRAPRSCVHSAETSGSRWLDRKMVTPAAFRSISRSRMSLMPRGSRPLVGSSRMSSCGRRTSAAARPSRWRMPSE